MSAAKLTPEFLAEFAAVVRSSHYMGHPPIQRAAQAFAIPLRTASHWAAKAREAGVLTSEECKQVSRKLIAVAELLGITPGELRDAIRTGASGRLILSDGETRL